MRMLACGLLLASAALAGDAWTPPSCSAVKCSGKRIENEWGILRICVPRSIKFKRESGEHGDQHFTFSSRANGRRHELYIVWGPYFTGRDPRDGDTRWSVRPWRCGDNLKGEDYRLAEGAMHTRYVTLNALMGYAKYERVSAQAAARFDKILDSLCCGECTACK